MKYTPPEEYIPKRQLKYRESNRYGCLLVGAESADPQNVSFNYILTSHVKLMTPNNNKLKVPTPFCSLSFSFVVQ